jgi:flagellar motor switch/type III secretory pathway protein FliN
MTLQPEARNYDPRREQGARLMEAASRLGGRLCEALNESMVAWLGSGYQMAFKEAELLYQAPAPVNGRVIWSGPSEPHQVVRVLADPGVFYRFYEGMLSGSSSAQVRPRRLGPTEMGLGVELGARWLACFPGLSQAPKTAELRIQSEEDAAPLAGATFPLLCLHLELQPAGEGHSLMFWLPLALLEGGSHKAEAPAPSQRLAQAPVRVQAILGQVRLRLKDLYELRVGDCVMLENGPQDEAVVMLSHRAVFKGRPGRNGRHLAIQLSGSVEAQP